MKWIIRSLSAIFIMVALVISIRSIPDLANQYKPIGACIKGAIDLDDPKPFASAEFGGLVIGIASSGGGSRAAYLTAAVLREMRRLPQIGGDSSNQNPLKKSLLDQIDVVSSVSGGSLASAYFVANVGTLKNSAADSDAWNDYLDKMAQSFRTREWFWQAGLNPSTWLKFVFTNYNRGVLARDDYDASLFNGARDETLADLPNRPVLYINSFDVANSVRFVFSKQYIDTLYYQPKSALNQLSEPQDITSENDLSFTNTDPGSIRLADAVYASSAYPIAYPNLALIHCGQKILFQGRLVFLADGGLADNSGLVTLFTQIKAGLNPLAIGSKIVALYVDASLDRIDTEGTRFQQRGIEDTYAWHDTIIGQGHESINATVSMLQDLGFKFIESTGAITDQLSANWPQELTSKADVCGSGQKACWDGLLKSGNIAMRPVVIRLGLRDLADPDLSCAEIPNPSRPFIERLKGIKTDFVLSTSDRKTLDVAARILVRCKLAGDLVDWNSIH